MDTANLKNTFQVPSFARREAYDFEGKVEETPTAYQELYQELNAIAEEIEKCRLRNC